MNTLSRRVITSLSCLTFFAVIARSQPEIIPVSRVLKPDGSLNLSPDFKGNLDPKGYTMQLGANGEPRFVPTSANVTAGTAAVPDDIYWSDEFAQNGVHDPIIGNTQRPQGLAIHPTTGDLYVTGVFRYAAEVPARNIAKWNGTRWDSLGGGLSMVTSTFINWPLVWVGADLYVGGQIQGFYNNGVLTETYGIAKWNGSTWSAVGGGVAGSASSVYALAVKSDTLYVGGAFTSAGGVPANYVARWDGTKWDSLGAGFDGPVYALAIFNDTLFAGGNFTSSGSTTVNRFAKWTGTQWVQAAGGANGTVNALRVVGSELFVGGSFTQLGGVAGTQYLARWNGSTVTGVTGGLSYSFSGGGVRSIVNNGGTVYVGGVFSSAGAVSVQHIARWAADVWTNMATRDQLQPYALAVGSNGDVFAGGEIGNLAGSTQLRLARYDGQKWNAVGSSKSHGMNYYANSLAVSGSTLYAGGGFKGADGVPLRGIGKYDGTKWDSLGSGASGSGYTIYSISVYGTNVYVAGSFNTMGGVTDANYVAGWNGSAWFPLGKGVNAEANAILAVSNSEIYVGGAFFTAYNANGTSVTVSRIARWSGAKWDSLGVAPNVGVSGSGTRRVRTLALNGDSLYVGGDFVGVAGGSVAADRIAKYVRTTNQWSALGSGVNGNTVYTIVPYGSGIYAGGDFTTAGGQTVNYVARWDGSNWLPLGTGVTGFSPTVFALALNGNDLYVGGAFSNASGVAATNIAKWNGSTWSGLGSGLYYGGGGSACNALAISGSSLYAGGSFTESGGKPALFVAKWTIVNAAPSPPTLAFPADGATNQDTSLTLVWNSSLTASSYTLQVSTDPAFGTTVVNQSNLVTLSYPVSGLSKNTLYYWRVSASNPAGTSAYSTSSFRTRKNPPAAPAGLVVTDSSSTKIGIKWRKNTEADFLRYRIYRGTAPTPTTKVDSTTGGLTDTSKTFTGLTNGTRYYLRVTAVDSAGNESAYSNEVSAAPNAALAAEEVLSEIPTEYSLSQNYPNPFNPSTVIRYGVPVRSNVKLEIYDMLGRQVALLVDQEQEAGFYESTWDANVPTGIYFYRMSAIAVASPEKSFVQVRKMMLLK